MSPSCASLNASVINSRCVSSSMAIPLDAFLSDGVPLIYYVALQTPSSPPICFGDTAIATNTIFHFKKLPML